MYIINLLSILLMSLLLLMISTLSLTSSPNNNKNYSFECGFDPFMNPRSPFSLQFFKILLIFIMFDIEIIIIIPMPLINNFFLINIKMITMLLMVLILGLYFEWKEGTLNWMK